MVKGRKIGTGAGETTIKGERSRALQEHKKAAGLPSWKELNKEFEGGFVARVEKKIALMERYAAAQAHIIESLNANGAKVMTSFSQLVDLQGKLWELEDRLRAEGKNPLESPEWMKARELASKELQFVQKHGLEGAKFQHEVLKDRGRRDDDTMFEVR